MDIHNWRLLEAELVRVIRSDLPPHAFLDQPSDSGDVLLVATGKCTFNVTWLAQALASRVTVNLQPLRSAP